MKVGINAPKSVPVYRKELYVQITDANKEAIRQADAIKNLKDLL